MVVESPASVSHHVLEVSSVEYVVLIKDMRTYETRTFALARKRAYPVEFIALTPAVGMIFYIFPHAVCNTFEFILNVVCIGYGVEVASELHPPEIVILRIKPFVVEFNTFYSGFGGGVVKIAVGEMVRP